MSDELRAVRIHPDDIHKTDADEMQFLPVPVEIRPDSEGEDIVRLALDGNEYLISGLREALKP